MTDEWKTSSYSTGNGQCVEVNCDRWHKSTRSSDTANCVEVNAHGAVCVRDSKDRTGPVLTFSTAAWRDFLGWLR